MNYSKAFPKAVVFFMTTILCVSSSQANAESDRIRSKVAAMLADGDWESITNLMNADYRSYKSSPSVEGFDGLCALTWGLYNNHDDQPTVPYWMFRKAAWKVILAPLPPITDPENDRDQPRTIVNAKRDILSEIMRTSRPLFRDPHGYDVYRRHDAAMLLLSYETWLKSYIVPNYQWKPVAPLNADLPERMATRQNGIDNEIQSELRAALGELASEYTGQIRDAYSENPKDEAEAKALIDAINMPEVLKQAVLKYAGEKPIAPNDR